MKRFEVWLCLCVIALGLAVASYSAVLRIRADAAYRSVILLMDWRALAALPELDQAQASHAAAGSPEPATAAGERPGLLGDEHWQLFNSLPGAMLCYGEETIDSLTEQGILIPARRRSERPTFQLAMERYGDDIYNGALRHGYRVERSEATGGKLIIELPGLADEELSQLPVCWLSEVRQEAREHDVEIVLRPGGSEFLGTEGIARTFDFAAGQQLMLFQGPAVLGSNGQLSEVAQQLKQHRMRFGWVEFDEQEGAAELAAMVAPYIIRVHSIPPEELQDLSIDTAVARLARAVRERNIRCLYVRPYAEGVVLDGAGSYREQLYVVNRDYFAALSSALDSAGFSIAADVPPPPGPDRMLDMLRRFFVAWAAGAAAILLLWWWVPAWPRWAWWVLRIGNVLAAVAAIKLDMLYTLELLVCALVFPLLGFWLALWLYQRYGQALPAWHPLRLGLALGALLVASIASAAGGLLIHGGLWSTDTMLKVGQFHGVTPALGLPVLLFAAFAWQAETLQDAFDRATLRLAPYWQRFMSLWLAPIRYGDVAFVLVALGALGVALLRSGNDSPFEVLSVESWFRGSLEQVFSVRPRTKELLGHPMLVVFLLSLAWRNRLALLFGLAALLGQVSILNTFCHLHTPLLLTLQRVVLGLVLGLISGALWGVVVLAANWVWARWHTKGSPQAPRDTNV